MSVKGIISVLDKAYGPAADGGDLLIKIHQDLQKTYQSIEYLIQPFVSLSDVASAGGLEMADMNKTLLEQFVKGLHDEDLIYKLRLEEKLNSPPSFLDLIKLVRTEESKMTERRLRH